VDAVTRLYSSLLWLLFIAGAPALTTALAIITIPLILTDVEAGLVLLLLPGVVTLAPLAGLFLPGEGSGRSIYLPALLFAVARVAVPIAIFLAWGSYVDESARDGLALLPALLVAMLISTLLWAWSLEYAIEVAPQLAPEGVTVTARRVDIQPSLEREQRQQVLRSRERRGRISRALEVTRPVQYGEAQASKEQSGEAPPTVVWGSAATNGNSAAASPARRGLLRFKRSRNQPAPKAAGGVTTGAEDAAKPVARAAGEASSDEGATGPPAETSRRVDVFTGHRDNG
jgi:hypothetical protein